MFKTGQLAASGLSRKEIDQARSTASGITWGTYADSGLDPLDRYRLQCQAVLARLGPDATLAGPSAAFWWDLKLTDLPQKVYVRNVGRGKPAKDVIRLPDGPAVLHKGLLGTPPDRVVADCARFLSARDSLIVADGALCGNLCTRADLDKVVSTLRNTHHVSRVRWVVANADERAESPGETWARMIATSLGYAAVPQFHVVMDDREAYLDLLLADGWTAIEFDGEVKYKKWGEVKIMQEKLRKADLEEIGYRLLEFVWVRLDDTRQFVNRLRYAGIEPTLPLSPIFW